MDLLSQLYPDVHYTEIKRKNGRIISGFVVGQGEPWAGAWFKTEQKAWNFSSSLRENINKYPSHND
jgi:hypothetical protein